MNDHSSTSFFGTTPSCILEVHSRMTTGTDLIVALDFDFATSDTTSPPGCDETDLATSRGGPLDRRGFTDVLMVTTSVGMLHRVHGHTSDNGPAVALSLVLVVRTTGLQDGLVDTATSSHDT